MPEATIYYNATIRHQFIQNSFVYDENIITLKWDMPTDLDNTEIEELATKIIKQMLSKKYEDYLDWELKIDNIEVKNK